MSVGEGMMGRKIEFGLVRRDMLHILRTRGRGMLKVHVLERVLHGRGEVGGGRSSESPVFAHLEEKKP